MNAADNANPTSGHADIAGYLLETLTADEQRQVDEHLATCTECRDEVESLKQWTAALSAVPDEMLLDGPPEDADLLLQRTLRQVRNEDAGRRHRRTAVVMAMAAAVVAVALAGGVWVGRGTATQPLAQPTTAPTTAASTPPGTRTAEATNPGTGARIRVAVMPAAGWVRVTATVAGIRAGERCRLEVVGRDGTAVLAGSWLVSPEGAAKGTTLNGSALIDPGQVASVRVVNEAGREFAGVSV
jgi:predicted anti-sigma-YlaC factor YlaD